MSELLNVVVCAKRVLDPGVSLRVDEKVNKVVQAEVAPVYLLNPADRAALEVALQLAATPTGARVTVLTLGPQEDAACLRYCLARGAHAAVRVWDEALADLDPYQTATVLARAAATMAPDLVICGDRTLDTGNAQVPAVLAELLSFSQLTGVVDVELVGGGRRLKVQRRLECGNRLVLESPLPALVAVAPGSFPERYVSWHAQLRAVQPVQVMILADLGLTPSDVAPELRQTRVVSLTPGRPRTKRTAAPAASGAALMAMMMGGGAPAKKPGGHGPVQGSPDQAAEEIVKFLQSKGYLPGIG